MSESPKRIAIIGGGAGGFFTALRCAEVAREKKVLVDINIFEATGSFLRKVKISGGGRCNVTHHQFDSREFCHNYPRGQKELLAPFRQFQAADTVEWFKERGVKLKHENDGRMFPVTNNSETIIDCFLSEAKRLKVKALPKKNVKSLKKMNDGKISLFVNEDESYLADSVMLATGSVPAGYRLAKNLGHTITELAPSLFTFKIQDVILKELSGISFVKAQLTLKIEGSKDFKQTGPLLITHWGLSGPALLKLSAWAAREMMHSKYQAKLFVNWLGLKSQEDIEALLRKIQKSNGQTYVANAFPKALAKRFWLQLLEKSQVSRERRWSEVSKKEFNRVVTNLFRCELTVTGKSRFKEEFVECGGINLKEINFKTMESKICPGLFFSGEVMDIDGITGGFNFQNAWTSGWIAGTHMV